MMGWIQGNVVDDNLFILLDNADNSKSAAFELSGISTGTNRIYTLPNASGIVSISSAALTAGRIPYVGAGGVLTDSANLAWDSTNNRLGIGTVSPGCRLDVYGTAATDGIRTNIGLDFSKVAAPPATFTPTAVAGAGLSIGQYYYAVTYYTAVGETQASTRVAVTTTAGNQAVSITGIPVSADTSVIGRKIYRNKVGEGSSYGALIATIANNTATTYSDTLPDASISGNIFSRAISAKANSTNLMCSVNGVRSMVLDASLTAFGVGAGLSTTVAPGGTYFGANAGRSVTYGAGNCFFGDQTGYAVTTGQQNVAMGPNALRVNTSGSYNIAFGPNTLYSNLTGEHNICAGYYAGNTVTGSGNIMLGSYIADSGVWSGNYNIAIGFNADPLTVGGSNQLNIGNLIYGTGAYNSTSKKVFTRSGSAQSGNVWEWQDSAGAVGLAVAANTRDLVLDTTTGTKIGTATTQKLGFWNATPVVQPADAAQAAATGTAGASYTATEQTLINDLKTLVNQLRSDLVTVGLIKGAA